MTRPTDAALLARHRSAGLVSGPPERVGDVTVREVVAVAGER